MAQNNQNLSFNFSRIKSHLCEFLQSVTLFQVHLWGVFCGNQTEETWEQRGDKSSVILRCGSGIERLVQPLHADVRWSGTSSLWVYNYFFCSVENLSWELPGSPRLTWENSTCSERKTRTFRDKLRELVQFKGYFPYFKSFVICLPQILSFTVQITHIFCYLPPLTNNNNWLKMHVYQC